jgi:hypothetical protein
VVQRAVITIGGQVAGPEDEDDEDLKPLPDRLVTELTAERTLALRDKLAHTPAVAFQAVLHKFCLDVFSRYFSYGTAMEVSVRGASFPVQAQGLKDTPAAKAIDVRHKAWEERLRDLFLPRHQLDLWGQPNLLSTVQVLLAPSRHARVMLEGFAKLRIVKEPDQVPGIAIRKRDRENVKIWAKTELAHKMRQP